MTQEQPQDTIRDQLAARLPAADVRQPLDMHFRTVAEIADLLRVSKMTVYRLVHAGELPAVRVGRRAYRVPEEAVHEYLRAAQPALPSRSHG